MLVFALINHPSHKIYSDDRTLRLSEHFGESNRLYGLTDVTGSEFIHMRRKIMSNGNAEYGHKTEMKEVDVARVACDCTM